MSDPLLNFLAPHSGHRPTNINDGIRAINSLGRLGNSVTHTVAEDTRAAASVTHVGSQYDTYANRFESQDHYSQAQNNNSQVSVIRSEDRLLLARGEVPHGPMPIGAAPGYGYGSSGPVNHGQSPLETEFVRQLTQASVKAEHHQDNSLELQRAQELAGRLTDPNGVMHLSGRVTGNMDGVNVGLNFGTNGRETTYSSFEVAAADIAKKTHQLSPLLEQEPVALNNPQHHEREQEPAYRKPDLHNVPAAGAVSPPVPTTAAPQLIQVDPPVVAAPPAPATAPAAEQDHAASQHAHHAAKQHDDISPEQLALNQQAQLALERMGLSTGSKNHQVYPTTGADEDLAATKLDGVIGTKTKLALQAAKDAGVEIDLSKPITQDTLAKLQHAADTATVGQTNAPALATAPAAAAPTVDFMGAMQQEAALQASLKSGANPNPIPAGPVISDTPAAQSHEQMNASTSAPAPLKVNETSATREIADSPERHAFVQAEAKINNLPAGLTDAQIMATIETQHSVAAVGTKVDGKLDTAELSYAANRQAAHTGEKTPEFENLEKATAALLAKEGVTKNAEGMYSDAASPQPRAAFGNEMKHQVEAQDAASAPQPRADFGKEVKHDALAQQGPAAAPDQPVSKSLSDIAVNTKAPVSDIFTSTSSGFGGSEAPAASAQQAPLQVLAQAQDQGQNMTHHEFVAAPTTPNVAGTGKVTGRV